MAAEDKDSNPAVAAEGDATAEKTAAPDTEDKTAKDDAKSGTTGASEDKASSNTKDGGDDSSDSSDSDVVQSRKKKKAVVTEDGGDDADAAAAAAKKKKMADVFGGDSSSEDESEAGDDNLSDVALSDTDKGKDAMEVDQVEDDDEEEPLPPAPPLFLEMSKVPVPGDTLKMMRTKLPENTLGIEPQEFSKATYDATAEAFYDVENKVRINVTAGNVVRWRHSEGPDGKLVPESNARYVEWDDGSVTLHIGDEAFEAISRKTTVDNSHVYVRHPGQMEGVRQLHEKVLFRPFTGHKSKTHKLLAIAAAGRTKRTKQSIKVQEAEVDPEAYSQKLGQAEARRAREKDSLARKQANMLRGYRSAELTSEYLEEGQDGEFDIGAVRAAKKRGDNNRRRGMEGDEDEGEARIMRAKRARADQAFGSSSEEEEDSSAEDMPQNKSKHRRIDSDSE